MSVISIPSELTEDEEKLLKKMAKMKKKKKQYLDLKLTKEQKNAKQIALKRVSSDSPSNDDAKETAKKLIKSGAIKLDTENKESGFKRSLSRKDDKKAPYSPSVNMDHLLLSSSPAPSLNNSPQKQHQHQQQYNPSQSPSLYDSPTSVNSIKFKFFNNNNNNGNNSNSNNNNNNNNNNNFNNTNQYKNTFNSSQTILHVKGEGINADYLEKTFSQNVQDAAIRKIEMKKTYAFVTLDSKESAEKAIKLLNDKVFNDIKLSVSFARPFIQRNTFDIKRNKFQQQKPFDNNIQRRPSSSSPSTNANNWSETANQPSASYSGGRNIVTYEDDQELFN